MEALTNTATERRVLDIDIDEALAKISDEELDFYYNKLVKGV